VLDAQQGAVASSRHHDADQKSRNILSATLELSSRKEFVGGAEHYFFHNQTWQSLSPTVAKDTFGSILVHGSQVEHTAAPITAGRRLILRVHFRRLVLEGQTLEKAKSALQEFRLHHLDGNKTLNNKYAFFNLSAARLIPVSSTNYFSACPETWKQHAPAEVLSDPLTLRLRRSGRRLEERVNTAWDFFGQRVYILHLANKSDSMIRLKSIKVQLRSVGIHTFSIWQGVNDPVGHRGAWRSHKNIALDALSRNLTRIIIFEDDVRFTVSFIKCWWSSLYPVIRRMRGHKIFWETFFLTFNPTVMRTFSSAQWVDDMGTLRHLVGVRGFGMVAFAIQGDALSRLAHSKFEELPHGTVDGITQATSAYAIYPMVAYHPSGLSHTLTVVPHTLIKRNGTQRRWTRNEKRLFSHSHACQSRTSQFPAHPLALYNSHPPECARHRLPWRWCPPTNEHRKPTARFLPQSRASATTNPLLRAPHYVRLIATNNTRSVPVCKLDVRIIAISMKSSEYRRARMKDSLLRLGCKPDAVTFVQAVESDQIQELVLPSRLSAKLRRRRQVEKAISLSHLTACRTALSLSRGGTQHGIGTSTSGAVLVLEDDADLDSVSDWDFKLSDWLRKAELPKNWSFVQVGVSLCHLPSWAFLAQTRQGSARLIAPRPNSYVQYCQELYQPQVWGLFAVLYSRQALEIIFTQTMLPDPWLNLDPVSGSAGLSSRFKPAYLRNVTYMDGQGVIRPMVSESLLLDMLLSQPWRGWVATPPLIAHHGTDTGSMRIASSSLTAREQESTRTEYQYAELHLRAAMQSRTVWCSQYGDAMESMLEQLDVLLPTSPQVIQTAGELIRLTLVYALDPTAVCP
jgi:GR25 family glycosyltransferase involved in LPS biosynthesis